jgi:hypothetical protein
MKNFKSKEDLIAFMTTKIAEIIEKHNNPENVKEEDDEENRIKQIIKELDEFLSEHVGAIRFFNLQVTQIIKPLMDAVPSLKDDTTTSERGITTRKLTLDDVAIIDRSGITLPNIHGSAKKFMSPLKFMNFCLGCLVTIFQDSFSAGKGVTEDCSEMEQAATLSRSFHQLVAVDCDDDEITIRALNLIVLGDAEKAANQTNKYLSKEKIVNRGNAKAIVQILPIHDMKRVAVIARSEQFFVAALFKYDKDFVINKDGDSDEIFLTSEEFMEYVESRSDALSKTSNNKYSFPGPSLN